MTEARPDPDIPQRIAADPGHSVWVSANAGSGKTKVLTDRVLRLLLSGTPASRILCITYTKAAAAEMETRIFARLSAWATSEDEALAESLAKLAGHPATADAMRRARTLFTRLLDESPGLRIQTIHAFCQSVLSRFPLEAGIAPHFTVLDGRSADELLGEAKRRLLTGEVELDPAAVAALGYFIEETSEASFAQTIDTLIHKRRQLSRMLTCPLPKLSRELHTLFTLSPDDSTPIHLRHFSHPEDERRLLLESAEYILSTAPGPAVIPVSEARKRYLSAEPTAENFAVYLESMLTTQGAPRKPPSFYAAEHRKRRPEYTDALERERERIEAYLLEHRARDAVTRASHLAALADAFYRLYEDMKRSQGLLDYDDLILHARRLLCSAHTLEWVLYKLDGGLDHLLLDEAQDTAPEQWEIAEALAAEFFSGETAREENRTLFVVGDLKQSIYRFQGADPAQFESRRLTFGTQADAARQTFETVALETSFRSRQNILDVVDETFRKLAEDGRWSLPLHGRHHAFHGAGGIVECWPPVPGKTEKEEIDYWDISRDLSARRDPARELALRIAQTIRKWLDDKRPLAGSNRPVVPGDILILVRSRGRFDRQIGRALREDGIPVAGLDRLVLTDDLAVRDLIALGRFVLLPEDDLTLACLLKSPLVGLDDDDLLALCPLRGDASLWEFLRTRGPDMAPRYAEAARRLDHWIRLSRRLAAPYDFYAEVIRAENGMQRFVARMGSSARESISAFLEQIRTFETSHPLSLEAFLHWTRTGRSEIKRDMEHGADAVRIMTVHGAKGLEAPVVILPQTFHSRPPAGLTLASHRDERSDVSWLLPLARKKEQDAPLLAELRGGLDRADDEERLRLLYVAMTRASEELYLCGVAPARTSGLPDWYDVARAGLAGIQGVEEIEEEHGTRLRLAPAPAASAEAESSPPHPVPPLPVHLRTPLSPEAPDSPVLSPSRLGDDMPLAALARRMDTARLDPAARGTLIHRLLEILGPLSNRDEIGRGLLASEAPQADEQERETMLRESLAILSDPHFAALFAPGSVAEAGIAGRLQNGLPELGYPDPITLSGQIDRLVVTDNEVLVLDYKTGELPSAGTIPLKYRRQMEAYRALLTGIYPGRTVRCALLYTSVPALLPVP